MWAVIEGANDGWGSASVIAGFAVGVAAVLCFVFVELRPGGMLDLSLFRRPVFSTATATAVISGFVYVGSNYTLSLRLNIAQGHTPAFTASAIVLIAAVAGVVGFATRPLLARVVGVRALIVAGLLCMAGADVWLAAVPITNRSFSVLLGFLILLGAGSAMTIAGMSAAAVNSVPTDAEPMAASTQGMARQIGIPLGVALIGAVVFSRAQNVFLGRVAALKLPLPLAHVALGIDQKGGVLGVVESGIGTKIAPVGQAATVAFGSALKDVAFGTAAMCVVMAGIVLIALRSGWAPQEVEPEELRQPGHTPASAAAVATASNRPAPAIPADSAP